MTHKEFLKVYFQGKIEHTYEALETLEKLRKRGFIRYVTDLISHRGFLVITTKGNRFIQ